MAGGEVVSVTRDEYTWPGPGMPRQLEGFQFRYDTRTRNGGASAIDKAGPGETGYLRLTRTGRVLTAAWGRDGRSWNEVDLEHRVGWAEVVRVGVVAENSYRAGFEATFDQFRVARAGGVKHTALASPTSGNVTGGGVMDQADQPRPDPTGDVHDIYGEKFRQAAIAVGGMPVSAGARWYHIQTEFRFDLSRVPATDRPALIGAIHQLIGEFEGRAGDATGVA